MNKKIAPAGRRGRRFSPAPARRDEGQSPRDTREYHRAWALRWDGVALSAARGKGRGKATGA